MSRATQDNAPLKVSLAEQAHLEFIELIDPEDRTARPEPTVKRKKASSPPKVAATSTDSSTAEVRRGASRARAPASRVEAPEGLVSPRTGKARVFRGKKHVISVSIAPHVLARVDAWATRKGMSRPAAIAFALDLLPE